MQAETNLPPDVAQRIRHLPRLTNIEKDAVAAQVEELLKRLGSSTNLGAATASAMAFKNRAEEKGDKIRVAALTVVIDHLTAEHDVDLDAAREKLAEAAAGRDDADGRGIHSSKAGNRAANNGLRGLTKQTAPLEALSSSAAIGSNGKATADIVKNILDSLGKPEPEAVGQWMPKIFANGIEARVGVFKGSLERTDHMNYWYMHCDDVAKISKKIENGEIALDDSKNRARPEDYDALANAVISQVAEKLYVDADRLKTARFKVKIPEGFGPLYDARDLAIYLVKQYCPLLSDKQVGTYFPDSEGKAFPSVNGALVRMRKKIQEDPYLQEKANEVGEVLLSQGYAMPEKRGAVANAVGS